MAFRRNKSRSRRSSGYRNRSRGARRQRSGGGGRRGRAGQTVRVVLEHVQSQGSPASMVPVGFAQAGPGRKAQF